MQRMRRAPALGGCASAQGSVRCALEGEGTEGDSRRKPGLAQRDRDDTGAYHVTSGWYFRLLIRELGERRVCPGRGKRQITDPLVPLGHFLSFSKRFHSH